MKRPLSQKSPRPAASCDDPEAPFAALNGTLAETLALGASGADFAAEAEGAGEDEGWDPEAPGFAIVEVSADVQAERADKVLARQLAGWSREKLGVSFERGDVRRAGLPLSKRSPVSTGDVLEVRLPEVAVAAVSPVEMPLELLYEDAFLAVVNKPAGLVVHPGNGVTGPTLVHGLLHRLQGALAPAGGTLRPGIVHRLDRDTTGVILVAKQDVAFYRLQAAFAERSVIKEYVALVRGSPALDAGECREPIGRDERVRTRMAVRPDGRPSHTGWRVLERLDGFTLIGCLLHTGRTHQIRVHLSHLGHPILGDTTYGFRPFVHDPLSVAKLSQVLLHSQRTRLAHPLTAEPLDFTAPLPAQFSEILTGLRALPPRSKPRP